MKLTTAKQGFRSLLAAFFLFGAMLFTAERVHAQSVPSDNLDWKTATESMQILDAMVAQLDGEMANLTPGTPAYQNVYNHRTYYKMINGSLRDNQTVPDAVQSNVFLVDTGLTDASPATKTTLQQLLDDAVALLTN